MTREQAVQALETGIEMVRRLKEDGYGLLATGEMGIGNTTTSSAVASVLLNRPAEEMTGRGAGLSGDGLDRKIHAIKKQLQSTGLIRKMQSMYWQRSEDSILPVWQVCFWVEQLSVCCLM